MNQPINQFAPGRAPVDGARVTDPVPSPAVQVARSATVAGGLTPTRARLVLGAVLLLGVGVAFNVLLLQRSGPHGLAPHGLAQRGTLSPADRDMTPGLTALPVGTEIKTFGLPVPPPPPPSRIETELKLWQTRLRQLEAEARGVFTTGPAAATGSASGAPAARVDDDPLAPPSQQTVRAVQRELTQRGYDPGPVDGNIGLMTRAAIMAFEHDEGLALSGEPSERLLKRLILGAAGDDEAPAGAAAKSDTAERLIRSVQQALAALKYAPGQADGRMSEETTRAIREFEMDQGLVPSGRVSGRLIVRLAKASGKAFVVPVR